MVLEHGPRLDVLVNNAGVMRNLDIRKVHSLGEVTRELSINLRGPVQMVQKFLPHLQACGDAAIVNITSGLAFVPLAISPVYSAAKVALYAYTRFLSVPLAASVGVFEVPLPGVETPLLLGEISAEMQGQKGVPVDVLVRQVIAGIERGRVEMRPGLSNILKALNRVAPEFIFRQLSNMVKSKAIAAA